MRLKNLTSSFSVPTSLSCPGSQQIPCSKEGGKCKVMAITSDYPKTRSDPSQLTLGLAQPRMIISPKSQRHNDKGPAGLSVDIFCWGSGAPTIWISKGFRQNLKGPSIEKHYQFSNFSGVGGWGVGVYWALRQNFTKAPLDFQGPRALTSWPPRAQALTNQHIEAETKLLAF